MLKKKKVKDSYVFLPNMNDKEEVMKYCRKMYPKGTKYLSVSVVSKGFESADPQFVSCAKNFKYRNNNLIWGEEGRGQLYYKGTWAKIIKDDREEKRKKSW